MDFNLLGLTFMDEKYTDYQIVETSNWPIFYSLEALGEVN
jgi:hypothetical protein